MERVLLAIVQDGQIGIGRIIIVASVMAALIGLAIGFTDAHSKIPLRGKIGLILAGGFIATLVALRR